MGEVEEEVMGLHLVTNMVEVVATMVQASVWEEVEMLGVMPHQAQPTQAPALHRPS